MNGPHDDCLPAAERDPAPLSPAYEAIRKEIMRLEPCHEHYMENVKAFLTMIGYMAPAAILTCGHACAPRRSEIERYRRALQTWQESDCLPGLADADTAEVFELLGERTDRKASLVEHLIAKLADNAYKVYDDEDEDFDKIESRIQHLSNCNYNWKGNFRIVLLEIAAGERLFDWHVEGGFNAHGDCPDRIEELKGIPEPVAAWAEGSTDDAGTWRQVLGQPTNEKRLLAALLCERVTEHHRRVTS